MQETLMISRIGYQYIKVDVFWYTPETSKVSRIGYQYIKIMSFGAGKKHLYSFKNRLPVYVLY